MATKAVTTTRRRRLPALRRRRRSNPGITIPLGIVAGFVPYLVDLKKGYDFGGLETMGMFGIRSLTGYDYVSHSWNIKDLRYGLLPILMGMGVHKFIGGKLGINRALGRAKIPFIRL